MSEAEEYPKFAAEHDAPIPYMRRIRDYYQGLGYGAPYRWAHYAEVPFRALEKPLAACRVALITTSPVPAGQGRPGSGCTLQRCGEILFRLFGGYRRRPRSADLSCRHRPGAHQCRGRQHLVSVAGTASLRGERQDRRGRTTLSRRADQPQPPYDDRAGLP